MPADPQASALILPPGAGRVYECGPMRAVFKADETETSARYSASEWTVAPHSPGSGPHSHEENDELFLITEGTLAMRVGDNWVNAPRGTFLRIPAGVVHDFENRTASPATLFNVFIPGGFERMMPDIVAWFASQPNAGKTSAAP
ncbi:cupin [Nibricoccus aquaticus]|uniref:Cupin n=1 Tax=Nibricoccus aquaticus TaxID=2576891 RepID=A0A290QNT2_9BACT|nr:cupin domain-containing protein [Nibricoccus aquaticus]ATC66072.1 cupin [Nibricoccus aquaticus]